MCNSEMIALIWKPLEMCFYIVGKKAQIFTTDAGVYFTNLIIILSA